MIIKIYGRTHCSPIFLLFFAVVFLQMHRLSLQFVLLKLCFNRSSFLVINYDDRVDG